MKRRERLCRQLGLDFPLFQAGMGGVAGPELAGAVSRLGCGGMLGLYRCPVPTIPRLLAELEALTDRAYGVNLIPEVVSEGVLAEQVEVVLETARPETWFCFYGQPPRPISRQILEVGQAFVVQVGSVETAVEAQLHGATAVVLQGEEAGGHLLGEEPLLDLVRHARRACPELPLIAAGGIAHGAQLYALEQAGADGCLCGTLFVPSHESAAHDLYKSRVVEAQERATAVTELFEVGWPGRRHRVLRCALEAARAGTGSGFLGRTQVYGEWHLLPRFGAAVPTSHATGRIEEMALYASDASNKITEKQSVEDIVSEFVAQYFACLIRQDGEYEAWISPSVA